MGICQRLDCQAVVPLPPDIAALAVRLTQSRQTVLTYSRGRTISFSMTQQPIVNVDAATFQKPLQDLAEVLSQKVKREAPKRLGPAFVAFDLHVLIRQAQRTLRLNVLPERR